MGAKIEVPSVEKPRTMRVLGDSLHSSPCLFQYFMPFSVFHAFFFYLPIPVQMWVFPNTDRSEWIRCSFIHDLRFTGDWTLNTKKQCDYTLSPHWCVDTSTSFVHSPFIFCKIPAGLWRNPKEGLIWTFWVVPYCIHQDHRPHQNYQELCENWVFLYIICLTYRPFCLSVSVRLSVSFSFCLCVSVTL